ncbi:unnamed protein product [Prorocentrum cordatum]|uniref:ubiquitinyl hydrolase 1 n=1 Tax=Prorocentrum cordatum TaxID=2364126 RepID=A0ABN9S8G6_9DINO|nr:unnamed protein product [Polarella glacialis]
MAVLIDAESSGMPVLRCSPDFLSLCGPICEGPKLLQWVINRADFMGWADTAYNDLLDARDVDLVQGDVLDAQPFRIRLKLPHMGPRVLEVSANAKFKFPSFEDPPEGDDGGVAIAQGILLMLEDVVFDRALDGSQVEAARAHSCQLRHAEQAQQGLMQDDLDPHGEMAPEAHRCHRAALTATAVDVTAQPQAPKADPAVLEWGDVQGSDAAARPASSVVDFLAPVGGHRFAQRQAGAGASAAALPEPLRKFEGLELSEVSNSAKVGHSRLGLRNDANNCYQGFGAGQVESGYREGGRQAGSGSASSLVATGGGPTDVNVVVQSLLPCSALMWVLRRCDSADRRRPFLSCFVSLCREFHIRGPEAHGEVLNVLLVPQMKSIISSWQKLGAQQDAGEFLLYVLNGLHEESKWGEGLRQTPLPPSAGDDVEEEAALEAEEASGAASAWAHVVKTSRRQVEERSAGLHEDSPITRIFGGLMQSSVRSKGAKVDSISLEPFNHLDLHVSDPSVKSVRDALVAFFKPEEVNDGQSTRQLHIKSLPKALILCLKRATFNASKGCAQKVKKCIQYDQKLSFDRSWFADADRPPPEYCISALICHHGDSVIGGHYTAFVRYNADWYLYDDTTVQKVEGREVAAQQGTAYLLVYLAISSVDMTP